MEQWQHIIEKEAASTARPVGATRLPPPAVRAKVKIPFNIKGKPVYARRAAPTAKPYTAPKANQAPTAKPYTPPKATKAPAGGIYANAKPKPTTGRQKFTKGAIKGVLTTGGLLTALGLARHATTPGDVTEDDLPEVFDQDSGPGMQEIGMHAVGGGAVAGLGSLLYGKLKDKPSLQRDVIMTLVGTAAGAAYPMIKAASQEKEADFGITATIIAILAATGAGMGQAHMQHKSYMNSAKEQQRALESIERAKLHESSRSRKAMTHGTVGALAGGAIGGTASNLYGKSTGDKSIGRDVMSALAGAGLGGAAGLYSATV